MKKMLFSLLFFFTFLYAQAELEHYTVRGNDFTSITETYEVYDSKGKVMKFYRDERNNDLKHLFSITLNDKTGTCGARSIEEGYYDINRSVITLYTKWDRQGRIYDVPYGVRIMRYDIQKDGSLKLLSSKIYIEARFFWYLGLKSPRAINRGNISNGLSDISKK